MVLMAIENLNVSGFHVAGMHFSDGGKKLDVQAIITEYSDYFTAEIEEFGIVTQASTWSGLIANIKEALALASE